MSEAVADTVTLLPDTVAEEAGAVSVTDGAVVSPAGTAASILTLPGAPGAAGGVAAWPYSSAPRSGAEPTGLALPSQSVVTSGCVVALSIAAEAVDTRCRSPAGGLTNRAEVADT